MTQSSTQRCRPSRSRRSERSACSQESKTLHGPHRSAELIERTRRLMELTIEFVDAPSYHGKSSEKRLETTRPASWQGTLLTPTGRKGIAFVTGLADSILLTSDEEKYLFNRMNFLKSRAEEQRRRLDLRHPNQQQVDRIEADLAGSLVIRNQIVQANLRLVVALARKLADSLEQMSELVSEGMLPLMRSVELFDVNLGNRFSTYATWAVRNQMLRHLQKCRNSAEKPLGEDAPSLENLLDYRSQSDSSEATRHHRAAAIRKLLNALSDRERSVISARFGLDGHPHGQSLAEISAQVGLCKERVRQIILGSLEKLRENLTQEELDRIGEPVFSTPATID